MNLSVCGWAGVDRSHHPNVSFAIIEKRSQTALEKLCAPLTVGILHHLQRHHINKRVVHIQAHHLLRIAIRLCHQVPHPRVTKLGDIWLWIFSVSSYVCKHLLQTNTNGSKSAHALNLPPPLWHASHSYSIRSATPHVPEVRCTVILAGHIGSPPGFSNTQQLDCPSHPVTH